MKAYTTSVCKVPHAHTLQAKYLEGHSAVMATPSLKFRSQYKLTVQWKYEEPAIYVASFVCMGMYCKSESFM